MSYGAITMREPVLDYRDYALPLTVEKIADDVVEVQAHTALTPGEIRMWEHQWDWLVKQVPEWSDDLDEYEKRVWGVSVVVYQQEQPPREPEPEYEPRSGPIHITQDVFVEQIEAEQQRLIDRVLKKVRKTEP